MRFIASIVPSLRQRFIHRVGAARLFSSTFSVDAKGSMCPLLLSSSRSTLNTRSIEGSIQRLGHEARQLSEGTLSTIANPSTVSTKDQSNGMDCIEVDCGSIVPSSITEVSEFVFVEHGR